ncbi:glycoside hydrolase family 88 protein [Adhaeribacter aquaticus]|uniref:glycoside hydrolase family 88 protein n=1 Tax=Adhaeribacter aquaticus TaxID=299567 RepID=UPI000415BA06|nr:glycoside hydrolase family 88 protein [Adhaeribacter aquaticus]
MNRRSFLATTLLVCSVLAGGVQAQTKPAFKPKADLVQTFNKNYKDAAAQYKVLMKGISGDEFPRSYDAKTNKLVTSGSDWWCSGFYPGTLLYLFEKTKDQSLYNEALRIMKPLAKEQYNKGTHDLGFMMFCSFGNANRIAPKPEYKEIMLNSARSLATRFSPTTGTIRSWDSEKQDFIVIIDNMMNLELLFWASKVSGDPTFRDIALTHANTTMKNHFRPDYSSYHVINYNPETGAVKEKKTAQGYADESAWARGQAWGLYGYVVMYRETKDAKYLEQANNIAGFYLNHPNLPKDKVPYWDFNAPNIPKSLRDASAASITASALIELSGYVDKTTGAKYIADAETMLRTLSMPKYKASLGTNGGFILKHGVGHFPKQSEIDVPLTYGDYYFVEAMKRYQELGK